MKKNLSKHKFSGYYNVHFKKRAVDCSTTENCQIDKLLKLPCL